MKKQKKIIQVFQLLNVKKEKRHLVRKTAKTRVEV